MRTFKAKLYAAVPLCALLLLLLTGCAKNRLKEVVDEVNKQCPISLGQIVKMMGATYSDDRVAVRYVIDERLMKIDVMHRNEELMKKQILATYSQPEGDIKKFVDVILDSQAALQFIYEGSLTGEKFALDISPEELRKAQEGDVLSAEDHYALSLQMINAQAPITISEGMVLTCMRDEGSRACYVYETSEPFFNNIASNLDNVKATTRTLLERMSEAEKIDMRRIPAAGRDLCYRYICTEKGDSVEFSFTKSQLVDILR